MAKGRKCRITVLKREYFPELAETYAPRSASCPCEKFRDGQEFILDQNGPVGFWHLMGGTFCSEAWAAIGHYTDTILQGGTFPTDSGENYKIACCPNGIRPVIFKIELVKEEANSEQ